MARRGEGGSVAVVVVVVCTVVVGAVVAATPVVGGVEAGVEVAVSLARARLGWARGGTRAVVAHPIAARARMERATGRVME